jgi:hypothetical protein
MQTVDIREDPTFTPYCTVCKRAIADALSVRSAAEIEATRHELAEHPDPEEEDG